MKFTHSDFIFVNLIVLVIMTTFWKAFDFVHSILSITHKAAEPGPSSHYYKPY